MELPRSRSFLCARLQGPALFFQAPGRVTRLAALGGALAGTLLAAPPAATPDGVEVVEKAAAEWVRARAETTRLTTEWSTQRQLLESMVNGLGERAQALEGKRDYLEAKTAKDREEVAALVVSNKAAAANVQATEAQLKTMDARLLQLRRSLPPRLSEALELTYKSLASPDLTVSERMQLTMTVLNRCTQFNRGVTCEEEILNVAGGKDAQQLEVIYWGLSHAYALDRPAGKAWFGSPGPDGWQWEALADAAKPVGRLIAIYRGKAEPEFVELPARVKNTAAETPGR